MSQWLKNYMKIKPTPEVDGVWMSLEYNMFGVPEKTEIIIFHPINPYKIKS